MNATTVKMMNKALSALNANTGNSDTAKAAYLDLFSTREDVLQFAREGTRTRDDSPQDELNKEEEWVDEAWEAVEEYISARDSE